MVAPRRGRAARVDGERAARPAAMTSVVVRDAVAIDGPGSCAAAPRPRRSRRGVERPGCSVGRPMPKPGMAALPQASVGRPARSPAARASAMSSAMARSTLLPVRRPPRCRPGRPTTGRAWPMIVTVSPGSRTRLAVALGRFPPEATPVRGPRARSCPAVGRHLHGQESPGPPCRARAGHRVGVCSGDHRSSSRCADAGPGGSSPVMPVDASNDGPDLPARPARHDRGREPLPSRRSNSWARSSVMRTRRSSPSRRSVPDTRRRARSGAVTRGSWSRPRRRR